MPGKQPRQAAPGTTNRSAPSGPERKKRKNEEVKPADKPDSVHAGCPARDRHSSGPGVTPPARCCLAASSAEPHRRWPTWHCCAQRLPVSPRAEARTRLCCSDPHLAPCGLRWRGVTSCAVLCSPDVPPVPCFHDGTSGGLAGFTAADYPSARDKTIGLCHHHLLCPARSTRAALP